MAPAICAGASCCITSFPACSRCARTLIKTIDGNAFCIKCKATVLLERFAMRVLILSINYWPEVTGIGAFTTYRAEYLAAAGHNVEVCTTFPYYPEWKVAKPYSGRLASSEQRNGVRIVRSYAYIPNPVTALKRILHEGTFVLSCFMRAAFRKRPDVLLVISPPLGLAVPAILLSRLWRTPYVFDVEDLQPDSAGDLRMLPSWAVKLLYKLESAAYRHAALVTTLTEGMRQRIVDKGIPREKIELLEPRMDDSLTLSHRKREPHSAGNISSTIGFLSLTAVTWGSSRDWMLSWTPPC